MYIRREFYQIEGINESFLSKGKGLDLSTIYQARIFAKIINESLDKEKSPDQHKMVRAGELNGLSLIDQALREVIDTYEKEVGINPFEAIVKKLDPVYIKEELREVIKVHAFNFPTLDLLLERKTIDEYVEEILADETELIKTVEEIVLLDIHNSNLAIESSRYLFSDEDIKKLTEYKDFTQRIKEELKTKTFKNETLTDYILKPILHSSNLKDQLDYIQKNWDFLPEHMINRILTSIGVIEEEQAFRGGGPGEAQILYYEGIEGKERYSPDENWMPRVVLIAKNTYVWLNQLSKKYKRSISRLDEIPDEELDQLAKWGFNALWLIGIWERSKISKKIKREMGNPEAEASAYSLYDYQIASDLGGYEAYEYLKGQIQKRGIRLSGDMVPNHTGLDSKWLIEHPDWFISVSESPFPAYSFEGKNLSSDSRLGLYLEDHYYTRTDAAVVFKRVDFQNGTVNYIYHGNDGTDMPWNDTAQLDFLKERVREAVINKIIHVAKLFPIIRFDAAMVLTKQHFQRLWYPEPGKGSGIPSRAEHGLSKEEFDKLMPKEFWREVVDRVAQEAPNTLLLAEAFWLLEGYFVRTLGMHRVYNSAFMNMLKNEENKKYRETIKNTLAFDPEILKRFVNFMNNPDEEPAVRQFGKGDKYFGICVLLATLPGLPMFGHGQFQGLSEKYGMEYRRAYWDEKEDTELVNKHEKIIVPLLKKRYLFAESKNFLLYSVKDGTGQVQENIFVYSNGTENEKSLVLYHNKYAEAKGWIRDSEEYVVKKAEEKIKITTNLAKALNLTNKREYYCCFKDNITGLEYIRKSEEMYSKGLYIELNAYQYHVFVDFYEIKDTKNELYGEVYNELKGRGTKSIRDEVKLINLKQVHRTFKQSVMRSTKGIKKGKIDAALTSYKSFIEEVIREVGTKDQEIIEEMIIQFENQLLNLLYLENNLEQGKENKLLWIKYIDTLLSENKKEDVYLIIVLNLLLKDLGKLIDTKHANTLTLGLIDELFLKRVIEQIISEKTKFNSDMVLNLLKLLIVVRKLPVKKENYETLFDTLFYDIKGTAYLEVNDFKGVLWFNKEKYERFIEWLYLLSILEYKNKVLKVEDQESIFGLQESIKYLKRKAEESEYKIQNMFQKP